MNILELRRMSEMTLGKRIKQLRKERELTQSELGKHLNVGKSTISQYETDTNMPDSDIILKIAEFFNVTTDYLLCRTNIRKPEKEIIATSREFGYEKDLPPEVYQQIKDYAEYVIAKHEKNKKGQ